MQHNRADDAPYAVVIGEALIDLIEDRNTGHLTPVPGGSPLNVAVAVARLGSGVEFVTSFGRDGFADRLQSFLGENGVETTGSVTHDVLTSFALTTFDGPNPRYAFYGHPHSYGLFAPSDLKGDLVDRASVVHAGSIGLLEPSMYAAAMSAFQRTELMRTLDPNVRGSLIDDILVFRQRLESLFGLVDVVKMSIEDAQVLYDRPVDEILSRVADFGASVVVITDGPHGARALIDGTHTVIPGRTVDAIDTTGAGDAFMGAIIAEMVRIGRPSPAGWSDILSFAVEVSACACCSIGGATAMPTRKEVAARFSHPTLR
ncbi:MAG TPA: carbohydrate kinase [Acidimicrobiia bacterium]